MFFFTSERSILQEIHSELFESKKIRVYVKRDDLIDPEVSGNKWRKLKYSIQLAEHQKKEGIITFGGAFSNHLLAVASACNRVGLQSIGLVRGDELTESSNSNLERCSELGMQLQFISRLDYQTRNEKWSQEEWKEKYSRFLLIPEGGANYHGLIGCQEIVKEIDQPVDHYFIAQGTTTTSCGLLTGSEETSKIHVVPVLKGFDSIQTMRELLFPVVLDEEYIEELLNRVVVHADHHFGGYAKVTEELMQFCDMCKAEFQIPLDFVYTAKAFKAMIDCIQETDDLNNSTVVFIHTGGLHNAGLV